MITTQLKISQNSEVNTRHYISVHIFEKKFLMGKLVRTTKDQLHLA